jgi:hypothetical protein
VSIKRRIKGYKTRKRGQMKNFLIILIMYSPRWYAAGVN